jgi:osmotically-inducible protein OsmY
MALLENLRQLTSALREPSATDITRGIRRAFRREADEDARDVSVEVTGHTVILRGSVGSWYEREDAERVAANSTGTRNVINQLTIRA